jgi:hypothetical protein
MIAGNVPLCIGLGWGLILYASIAFADLWPLSRSAWVAVVTLFGLNVDFGTDALAVRAGFWVYHHYPRTETLFGLDEQWLGVPYGNFYSWFVVLFASAGLLRRWVLDAPTRTLSGLLLRATGVIGGGVLVLAAMNALYVRFWLERAWPLAVLLAASVILTVRGWRGPEGKPRASSNSRSPHERWQVVAAWIIPVGFHAFFLALLAGMVVDPTLVPNPEARALLPAQASWLAINALLALFVSLACGAALPFIGFSPCVRGSDGHR